MNCCGRGVAIAANIQQPDIQGRENRPQVARNKGREKTPTA